MAVCISRILFHHKVFLSQNFVDCPVVAQVPLSSLTCEETEIEGGWHTVNEGIEKTRVMCAKFLKAALFQTLNSALPNWSSCL